MIFSKYIITGEIRIPEKRQDEARAAAARFGMARKIFDLALTENFNGALTVAGFDTLELQPGVISVCSRGQTDTDIVADFLSSFSQYLTKGSYLQVTDDLGDVFRLVVQRGKVVKKYPKW